MKAARVVYNDCYGGFSLSKAAIDLFVFRTGATPDEYGRYNYTRHDPELVAIVEELGVAAGAIGTSLRIDEGVGFYRIHDHDGQETVEWFDPGEDWIDPNEQSRT